MDNKSIGILVIDDSPVIRTILCSTLHELGYPNCYEAEHGREGLEILKKKEISLILTDWNMPEMNGLEVVTEIRNSEMLKRLPIIMVTTRGMKDDVLEAVHAGVNDYLIKPFTPQVLEDKINKLITSPLT